jgi:hypothetical protein
MNRVLLSLAAVLVSASFLGAQEALAPGTPLGLLARAKVQKELKLSADQVKAITALTAAARKGTVKAADVPARLEKVLKVAQRERLEQIGYQVRGGEALADSKVAEALRLTKKQKAAIAEFKTDADRELRMLLTVARFRNEAARVNFIRNHYGEAGKKMLGVLDATQKKQFTTMQGKPFDTSGLDRP